MENTPSNPSELSTSTSVRIQMLGGTGVGKTCFVAGLALLNERPGDHSFVLPTDDATKAIFDTLRDTLKSGHWPAKTSIVNTIRFAVIRGRKRIDVQLSDFAGESFLDAMQRGDQNDAAQQVQQLVADADLLMVMLDGAAIDRKADFAGSILIQAVFEKLFESGQTEVEVAVVLTKSDLCVGTPIRTAAALKQTVIDLAPDIHRFLSEQQVEVTWVPLSVCGADATDASDAPVYSKLSPEGYQDLFDQLFRRSVRARNRWFKIVGALTALAALLLFGWLGLRGQQIETEATVISDSETPVSELPIDVSPENNHLLVSRYVTDLDKAKQEIDDCGNTASIDLVLTRFANIPESHRNLAKVAIDGLMKHASDRRENILYNAATDCLTLGTGDCVVKIGNYLSDFPEGIHSEELRQKLDDINEALYLTARGKVKSIPVNSPDALRHKKDEITRFMADYETKLTPEELASITLARDTAAQFLTSQQYHCKLVRTSGLDQSRDHGVEIRTGGNHVALYNDSGDVVEMNWSREFTLSWKSGADVQVKLLNYDGLDQDMAYFEDQTPVAIVLLAKEQSPTRYPASPGYWYEDFSRSRPNFKIKLECTELDPPQLSAISGYLLPGDQW